MKLIPKPQASNRPVERMILGQFIEAGFGRQVDGLWSEMIYNRAFRPVPPYSFYTWEWLGFEEPMYNETASFWHSGYEEIDWKLVGPVKAKLTHGVQTFKGRHSYRIDNEGGLGGVSQDGIHVEKDRGYSFTVFGGIAGDTSRMGIRDSVPKGRTNGDLFIRFVGAGDTVVWEGVAPFTALQDRYEFSVTFPRTETVRLDLLFDFEGGIYLSWVSMMPDDNMKGFRRDVVECLRKAQVPIMRFPGGCFVSFYDWESSVGPRERREPQESHYWGGLEENDVGLDEFCDLAEMVGFEPQICFNMMSSTPFKARQMVEYLNAPADVGMGRLRALNGYPEPRGVKYFEMDNETDRKWGPLQYAQACVEFIDEMRLADPSIQFMMEAYRFPLEGLREMLDIAGGHINFIIQRDGSPAFVEKNLEILRQYNADTGHDVRLVNTEWLGGFRNHTPINNDKYTNLMIETPWGIHDTYETCFNFCQTRWYYALNAASRVLDYMSYGGEFFSANFNNCCNTWGQNIVEASKDAAWLSCAGEMFAFISRHFRENALVTSFDSGDPLVRAEMLVNEDGATLYLINNTDKTVELEIPGCWAGESLSAPEQLSMIREDDDPMIRAALEASGTITLAPFTLAAVVKK